MTSNAELDIGRDPYVVSRAFTRSHGAVVIVVALGGGFGALARYGLALMLPSQPGGFPWSTFTANVLGCFLIGVLMVLITEACSAHRLLRPFIGVGALGGFTTFSTYAVESHELMRSGLGLLGVAYLATTLLCALTAVVLGVWSTRRAVARFRSSVILKEDEALRRTRGEP